jgi:uroporphyrinogen-III synthase
MVSVVLTRPTQQAHAWAEGISQHGYSVIKFPLIEITPCSNMADEAALAQAWSEASHWDAIMFVSHPAVQMFFDRNQPSAVTKPAQNAIKYIASAFPQARFWVTGPGTLAGLRALGMPPERVDAPEASEPQFDSEALWRRVSGQMTPGKRVLIVRGRDVGTPDSSRDWLTKQIQERNAFAQNLVVYERRAPIWTDLQLQQSQHWLRDGSIWLFSSSQALRNLPVWLDVSSARCICTHERIAENANARGFAVVCTSRPTLEEVARSIKSIHE